MADTRFRWCPPIIAVAALMFCGCDYVTRVNVNPDGSEAARGGWHASLSADGRFVAFSSWAPLVAGDVNDFTDVFVRDMRAGITTRVSVDSSGGDANQGSVFPSISANGRYVAFNSFASDLVAGDGPHDDVFVRDLQAGTTRLISVDSSGGAANDDSRSASISPDGRYVGFISEASDLVPGDGTGGDGIGDVFVHDLQTGTTTRVNVDTAGGDANDSSVVVPSISAGGRYVAFGSLASDLVPADNNSVNDVFVRDMQTGVTSRASVDTNGGDADGLTIAPDITPDGRYVTFVSEADDIAPQIPANHRRRVFIRDLSTGQTTRASIDANGGSPNQDTSPWSAVSADGRYVIFESTATDLVVNDTNNCPDIFVRDRVARTTRRQSVDVLRNQTSCDGSGSNLAISDDGRHVAFDSDAWNLVPGDSNEASDVFVRSLVK